MLYNHREQVVPGKADGSEMDSYFVSITKMQAVKSEMMVGRAIGCIVRHERDIQRLINKSKL